MVVLHDNLVILMMTNFEMRNLRLRYLSSLMLSIYLAAIATMNWQDNPTITTLKVFLSLYEFL